MGKSGGVSGKKSGGVDFEPAEESGILDQRIFDDFGIAGAHVPVGESGEDGGVDQHQRGLVESADEVLAGGDVDRGLAADRTVDLGKQRGRYLDEMAATLDDGGGEPDEIADHAAAERDQMVAALDPQREQLVDQGRESCPALAALAGLEDDRDGGDRA